MLIIYLTSTEARQCAYDLDDVQLHDSLVNVGRVLSGALALRNLPVTQFTPAIAPNEYVRWTHSTRANFTWMLSYFSALGYEYVDYRCLGPYDGFMDHMTVCAGYAFRLPDGPLTQFPIHSPGSGLKENFDVILTYRRELLETWYKEDIFPTWTNRNAPAWAPRSRT